MVSLSCMAQQLPEEFECSPVPRARGWARVSGPTLVTDTGTLLRGVRFSLDVSNGPPQDEWVAALPCRGINTLHVYAEHTEANRAAGYNEEGLCKMIQQTADNGMYLIITVGGKLTMQFIRDFWTHYAPRLKGYSHLIFEIANEPYLGERIDGHYSSPFDDEARQMEADAYAIIRGAGAHQTPVLLMSYGLMHNTDDIYDDLISVAARIAKKTVNGVPLSIDWTRTAVAFHGYTDQTVGVIDGLLNPHPLTRRSPIPVMETELGCATPERCARNVIGYESSNEPIYAPDGPYTEFVRAYEARGISWVSFLDIGRGLDLDLHWNQVLTREGIVWMPDRGTFPAELRLVPLDQPTIVRGESATLQVRTTRYPDNPSLRYQWFQGYSGNRSWPIAGATSRDLLVQPVITTPYWVEVKDDCGNMRNSDTAIVTVNNPVSRVALRGALGTYVAAEGGGGGDVNCNRSAIGAWETFTLVDLNGGLLSSGDAVNIQVANDMYVSAPGGGGGTVAADRTTPGEFERFTIEKRNGSGTIRYGDSVAFRSSNDYYLVAESGGNDVVKCDRLVAGPWETFTIVSSWTPEPDAGDLDEDRRSDIVWRTNAGGHLVWLMNATTPGSTAALPARSESGWEVVASGDFNGDGGMDLFWRRDTRANGIWFMNGAQVLASAPVIEVADPNIRLAGAGDFNADGKTDLFWRNDGAAQNYVWLMNGSHLIDAAIAPSANADWRVAATADFNGDGRADLAWRNVATGENAIWLMNGTTLSSSGLIISVPQQEWKVVMAGDYDGDGRADLFWRNEQSGVNAVWLMNGTTVAAAEYVRSEELSWRIVAGGDYDGDGKSDLLWRDSAGRTRVWLVNRFTATVHDSAPATGLAAVVAPSK